MDSGSKSDWWVPDVREPGLSAPDGNMSEAPSRGRRHNEVVREETQCPRRDDIHLLRIACSSENGVY